MFKNFPVRDLEKVDGKVRFQTTFPLFTYSPQFPIQQYVGILSSFPNVVGPKSYGK